MQILFRFAVNFIDLWYFWQISLEAIFTTWKVDLPSFGKYLQRVVYPASGKKDSKVKGVTNIDVYSILHASQCHDHERSGQVNFF